MKYGHRARIRIATEAGSAIAEVIGDGAGLPDDEIEHVFEPFYRSEAARASDKAGSGLGLGVCRSIARAHGGDVHLINASGGLCARMRVPLAFGPAPSGQGAFSRRRLGRPGSPRTTGRPASARAS